MKLIDEINLLKKNYINFMNSVSKGLVKNLIENDKAIERERLCSFCPHLFKPTFTCKKCGCFMKIKIRLANSKCPVDKWDSVEN